MAADLHMTSANARSLLGRSEPPAEPISLTAGPVTALLHEGDLRHVRVGDVELAQRIYVAVRDAVWNTIPGVIDELEVRESDDGFQVTFLSEHRHEDIHFVWRADIRGTATGLITYRMHGEHRSSYRYAKIGLNVHHPITECIGRPFEAHTPDGKLRGTLPIDIEPQLVRDGNLTGLFAPYDELKIELADRLALAFRFAGELFEMQDHRNWTDANFKSYCTPVALPWPFDAQAGEHLDQAVELSIRGPHPQRRGGQEEIAIEVHGGQPAAAMPEIGFGLADEHGVLRGRALELLRNAGASHVRFDLSLEDPDAAEQLGKALAAARELHARVELGVFATQASAPRARQLTPVLEGAREQVARVLVFAGEMGFSSTSGSTTPIELIAAVRAHLTGSLGEVPFAGGTNQFFTELNRNRPDPSGMDGLVYSINPQVHAADDWSLMENVRAQAATVAMAAKLAPGLPLFVGPVTLVGRYGPFPAGPALPTDPPANVDPRQGGLFCAAWTVGSIAEIAHAGARSITYFETTGARGLVPDGQAAAAFPVYHVFADIAELAPTQILRVAVSDSQAIAALALRGAGRGRLLIANLTASPQRVVVSGAFEGAWSLRALDISSAHTAMTEPEAWRAGTASGQKGRPKLGLGPYATLVLTEVGEPR